MATAPAEGRDRVGGWGRRLRVLLVADELEPHGGAERSQLEVAEALANRGHVIDVVYSQPGAFLPRYAAFARSLQRVPATQGDGRHRTNLKLFDAGLRGLRMTRHVDVVYANSVRLAFLGAAVSTPRRLPLVCHLRLPELPASSVKIRLGLAGVSRFIAVSEHTRNSHVRAGVPADLIDVVHNGIDTRHFPAASRTARQRARRDLGIGEESFVVLYAGRLDAAKGIEVLLGCWSRGAGPDDVLLLAGAPREHADARAADSYVDGLRRSTRDTGVRWLGRRLDMVPLYTAADVVVLPSLFAEPFGRVVVEAMACGRPVVATTAGGLPEVLAGFPELLVPPGDPEALRSALERLRDWPRRDPALAARLRDHVEQSFSLRATAAGIERVLTRETNRGR